MSKIVFAAVSSFIDDEPSTGTQGRSADKGGGNKPPPVVAGGAHIGIIVVLCVFEIAEKQGMVGTAGKEVRVLGRSEDSHCSKGSKDSTDRKRREDAVG